VALNRAVDNEMLLIEVFGMQGEKVISERVGGFPLYSFSLSGRPAGIYFLRLIAGDKTEVFKIVKQ
jgi:hypothetical protein